MSGISRLSGSHFHFHDIMPTEGAREPQPSTESAEPEAAGVEEGETEEEVSVEYFGERVLIAPPDRRANPDPQGVRQKAGGEVLNGQHAVRGTEVQGKGHFGLGALAPPITHEDVTMAQLALSAHELNPEPLPNGWREVTGDELGRLTGGLPTEVPATGFEAHLYIRETRGLPPEYVLAFRGTDNISTFNPDAGALDIARHRDLAMGVAALVVALEFETRDAWTNAINAAGRRAPQYEHAQAMARRISESIATLDSSVPGDIGLRYTGLSLGGGLATAAALATGHPATIFNPADVAATYVVDAQSRGTVADVRRFTVVGEPLQYANASNSRTVAVGTNRMIEPARDTPLDVRHWRGRTILDAMRSELREYNLTHPPAWSRHER